MIDVLVVGGGPVGLVTAINAKLSGLDVTVAEPREGAIDKACGEGLMPDSLARLAAIGVDPPGRDFHGIRYVSGTSAAEARFDGEPGRGVRRTALQSALMNRANELGVRFVQARVESIVQDADGISTVGVRSRYLIGADGLHSQVRRNLGLDDPGHGRQRFGVRQHFAVAPWSDMVEVHWLSDGELYVTPVGDDLVGVAVLGTAPMQLDAAISRVPALAERLVGAPEASTPRGAGPLRQRASRRTSGHAILVGDAAGYIDALTGEGLSVGFAEAEAAVRAIVANTPGRYESEWRSITRSYRWLTTSLLWTTSRPTLRPMVVPAARAWPWAFRRVVNNLAY